jgi:hypothetical protein
VSWTPSVDLAFFERESLWANALGVRYHERVLGAEFTLRPNRPLVRRTDPLDLGDQLVAQLGRLLLIDRGIGIGYRRLLSVCPVSS